MSRNRGSMRTVSWSVVPSSPAFAKGFADVRAGRGFDCDDTRSRKDQHRYERGRQFAVLFPHVHELPRRRWAPDYIVTDYKLARQRGDIL